MKNAPWVCSLAVCVAVGPFAGCNNGGALAADNATTGTATGVALGNGSTGGASSTGGGTAGAGSTSSSTTSASSTTGPCVNPTITPLLSNVTQGYKDGTTGPTGTAEVCAISRMAFGGAGNLFIADGCNNVVYKLDVSGNVTTLAGSGPTGQGYLDGPAASAKFYALSGIAVDSAGNVYVGDNGNFAIRKISTAGVVSTLAGGPTKKGFADGSGGPNGSATLNPLDVAVDGAGNVYFSDESYAVRKIDTALNVTTLAGAGTPGLVDGTGTSAKFQRPEGLAVDAAGNVYVADDFNGVIRRITAAGVVSTLTAAVFSSPLGLTIDPQGNLYVADRNDMAVRKVDPTGAVTTLAGPACSPVYASTVAWAASGRSGLFIDNDTSGYRIAQLTP